jgi:hypothetical protein
MESAKALEDRSVIGIARMKGRTIIKILAVTVIFAAVGFRLILYDSTVGRAHICKLHGVAMSKHIVDLRWGMKFTDMNMARYDVFPYADEPYESGWCMPTLKRYARVFVCAHCTEARASWLVTNASPQR